MGTGRPDVVLQGRPSPGAWDHPWVTYCAHVDSYGIQGGRQLLVADEPAGHLTRRAVDPEAATDGEYAVSARRPGVPPRPTMSAAARAQLEVVLPPPPDFGPRPATGLLSTTMLLTLTGKREPIADVLLGAKRARSLGTSDDRSNAAPGGSGHSGGDEGHSSSMLPSLATQPPPPARGTKRVLAPGPVGDVMRAPRHASTSSEAVPRGLVATGVKVASAGGSRKRARFREPFVEVRDDSECSNSGYSDDGDAQMETVCNGATDHGLTTYPTMSWRPPGLDSNNTTTTGADRASSAGQDPSSGT